MPGRLSSSRSWVLAALPTALLLVLLGLAFSGAAAPTLVGDAGALVRWGRPVVTVLSELAAAVTIGSLVLLVGVLPRPARARAAVGPQSTGRPVRAGADPHPPTSGPEGARARNPHRGGSTRAPRVSPDGAAWGRVATLVAWSGPAWAILLTADLVLGYASTAGRALGGAGFEEELWFYITELSSGRAALTAVVIAAVAALACVAVAGYGSAVLAGVLAVAVLVPIATTGHAAGTANHELGMSAMWLHLISAAIWIGGLAALCVVASRLGRDLPAVVARYSRIAVWCFLGVGISGVANAWIRLGTPAGLATPYGALLLAKVAVFVALGAAGYVHRRRMIPAVARAAGGGGGAGGAFWRLAGVEVLLMGVVSGLAVALGSTGPPVPQVPSTVLTPAEQLSQRPVPPAPTAVRWLTEWTPDLLFLVVTLALAVVYLGWVVRMHRRGDRWEAGRTASWMAGVLGFGWVTLGGPAVYGQLMFSAHMLMHMTLVMVLPILFVLGAPVTLAMRALPAREDGSRGPREWLLGFVHSPWARLFANPLVAAVNFAGSMIVFYYTPLFSLALTTHLGHILMVVHFTLAGYLFANVLIGIDPGPTRPGYPLRLLLLFATMAFHAFFGITIISSTALLAPDYFGALGLPWGVDALADQGAGGEITWGIGEIPTLGLAIAVALAWSRDDERTARRTDRAADRDDDAELKAYNAMLERISRE